MNTIRTVSAQFVAGIGVIDFYIDIPFEVDMVKLVDTRSRAPLYSIPMIPRVSFLSGNQIVCLANKSNFGATVPIEFWYNRPTPIIGTYTISNDLVGETDKPQSYVMFVFEFWSFKADLPRNLRPTNWQSEVISVSSRDNTFALDIRFPVDEIIIENYEVILFNRVDLNSIMFYSDFIPPTTEYIKNADPLVGTNYVSNGLSKSRVAGSIIGVVNNNYATNAKYRYRFAEPQIIRGNYRVWNAPDPQPYPASTISNLSWYVWNTGIATFFIKFISYR